MKTLLKYFEGYKKECILGPLFKLLEASFELMVPLVVKRISGRTALEWIENYVTMELRVALKNSTRSIKEIAEDMNFPNQSFLGKYFKEHVGMTPSEYRKS